MKKPGKNPIFVSPNDGDWRVHKPGAAKDIKNTADKQEAIKKAVAVAKNQGGEVIIQNQNGQISQKNTYPRKSDPREIKG